MIPRVTAFTLLALLASVVFPPSKHKPKHVVAEIDALRANGKAAIADRVAAEINVEKGELVAVHDFPTFKPATNGRVIVGRVVVTDAKRDPRDVMAQMEIFPEGWFVEGIADAEVPVGFRLEGYEPVDLLVGKAGEPGDMVWVGEIRLVPLAPTSAWSIPVKVMVDRGNPPTAEIAATVQAHDRPNTTTGGSEPRPSWNETPLRATARPGKETRIEGAVPSRYWVRASAPGYRDASTYVDPRPHGVVTLTLVALDGDEDGIIDIDDKCPADPESRNGRDDHDGCPEQISARTDPTVAIDEDVAWLMKTLGRAMTFSDTAAEDHWKHGRIESRIDYSGSVTRPDGCTLRITGSALFVPHWSSHAKVEARQQECTVNLADVQKVTITAGSRHFPESYGVYLPWTTGTRSQLSFAGCVIDIAPKHDTTSKRIAAAVEWMSTVCRDIASTPAVPVTRDDGERRALASAALARGDCRLAAAALEQVSPQTRDDLGWILLAAKAHACGGSAETALAYYRAAKAKDPTVKVDAEIGDLLLKISQTKAVDRWWLRD